MLTALGIILFIIGCCISSYEDTSYKAERREEERHQELMKALSESKRINETPVRQRKSAEDLLWMMTDICLGKRLRKKR